MIFSYTWFWSRWQSLCQGSVLQNYSAFKKALWKIFQTLQNHLPAGYTIVHSPPSRVYTLCPSSFPYVYAWTCYVQIFLWENTTSSYTSYNWWGIQVWNFLDSKLQNWLLTGMQAPIQDNLARVWRHWKQIWVNFHIWTHLCYQLGIHFLYHIFYQA